MGKATRTIIFDFDGTIVDSFNYVLDFLCREAGRQKPLAPKQTEQYRGMSMKDMALKVGIPAWRLPLVYFRGRRLMRGYMPQLPAFAGMLELIRQLHSDGYRLYIVSSNSNRNVKIFLRQHNLTQCFTGVRGGAGFLGKASIVSRLLIRSKVKLEDAWYVGDEVTDIASAKAAGTKVVAVTWGFAEPGSLERLCYDAGILPIM